jgi:hypothetical protein
MLCYSSEWRFLNNRVMLWMLDNEKYSAVKTRCSTDGSDRGSSHKRSSHKRYIECSYEVTNICCNTIGTAVVSTSALIMIAKNVAPKT